MKRMTSSALAVFWLSFSALAETEVAKEAEKASQPQASQAEKATKRKKRVLICKDCGKPETQCECKGEEHRKGDPH
ncbi:MAG: hypothetical protein NDJ89_13165 [Oligoflexia bacterium]|nr:hypothetical protein [Oligoflexia bacterium]